MNNNLPGLFDVNAVFGRAAAGVNDCPTMAERLAHMNRLGIVRALVWNAECDQNHALSSNDRLLRAISETGGARDRIFPALTVSGLMHYERDGVKALKRQMTAGRTRALRFYNVFGRLTLSQLDPVVASLRPLKPFIILKHDQAAPADILDFTKRFPEIQVVITDVIWGRCIGVFDLMRQRKNILLDISWLHTWEGIELAVGFFGARRVLFGTGYRSHNGAAIAALARAKISSADRRLIAHSNLDRLIGLDSSKLSGPQAAPVARNLLWRRCLDGKHLGVDLIDAHAHLGPSAGYVLDTQDEDSQIPPARRIMDALGMKLMIFSGMQALLGDPVQGNDLLARKLRGQDRRFAAYLVFNPLYAREIAAKFDTYFRNPLFIGFKTLCSYWKVPITDKRFIPMWKYADLHRLPMLMHSWQGDTCSPGMIDSLAARYPQVAFLLGHSGGGDPGRAEAEQMAKKHNNVYLETCGSFCAMRPLEKTLEIVGPRKIVFGTDAMAHDTIWELGRILSMDAPASAIEPILGANLRRILAQRR